MANPVHLRHGTQMCSWKESGVMDAPLCGSDSSFFDSYTDRPDDITCPRCAEKWAKNQFKASAHTFTFERSDNYRNVRSAYKVFIDGEHRGDVVLKGGRYGKWQIHSHDGILEKKKVSATGREYTVEERGYRAKEQAGYAMLQFLDRLPTKTEYDMKAAEDMAAYHRRRQARLRERDEENVEYDMSIETLREMIEKGQPVLTNAQRVAVEVAMKAIKAVRELNN